MFVKMCFISGTTRVVECEDVSIYSVDDEDLIRVRMIAKLPAGEQPFGCVCEEPGYTVLEVPRLMTEIYIMNDQGKTIDKSVFI